MQKTFDLTIRTPDKEVFNGKVKFLTVKSEGGVTKILPGHADLTTTVRFSPLIFETTEKQEEDFIIRQALVQVNNPENRVEIMAIQCSFKTELNLLDAEEYLKFIEEQLAKGVDVSEFKIKYLQEEKFAIESQIKAVKK